jgi:hypothetical protein
MGFPAIVYSALITSSCILYLNKSYVLPKPQFFHWILLFLISIPPDSDGAFAVDYVAAKLVLKGTLYVSDIPFGRE